MLRLEFGWIWSFIPGDRNRVLLPLEIIPIELFLFLFESFSLVSESELFLGLSGNGKITREAIVFVESTAGLPGIFQGMKFVWI